MPRFVDRVSFHCKAGNGGNGAAAVRRMRGKPLAGASGGNGGDGGSVIVRCVENLADLSAIKWGFLAKAQPGECGKGSMRNGSNGADFVLNVPVGTTVTDGETGEVVAELGRAGEKAVVAKGGRGGKGNFALASASRKAPGFALMGTLGEEREVVCELKLAASCALIGYPNAGKSSLLAAISNARPRIGDWEFTTLSPNLGVVRIGEESFTVEDVPGLVDGAGQGRGLGLEFLKHVEKIPALAFVIDPTAKDPLQSYEALERELSSYERENPLPDAVAPFSERPRIVILSKADLYSRGRLLEFASEFEKTAAIGVSASTHEGMGDLKYALLELSKRAEKEAPPAKPLMIRPASKKSGRDFSVKIQCDPSGEMRFEVDGEIVRRYVQQTDFSNGEAVGYLSDRLAALGVEDMLVKAGIRPGMEVRLGNPKDPATFSWTPSLSAGERHMRSFAASSRGRDERLDAFSRTRRTNSQRRAERKRVD